MLDLVTMLVVNAISCSVAGQKILNQVTFSVPENQTLGIIGPNGSGKTTLFNCLSGFHRLSSGSIQFRNQEISSLSPHKRAHLGVGRVFQNFGIFREMTLFDNVRIALESKAGVLASMLSSSLRTEAKKRAHAALESVGLYEKRDQLASSLSGGQMRLLEIARTVAADSRLILLDEPTAGVSPIMKQEVGEQISKLKTLGCTALIIEHDIGFIQRFCDRVIVLNEGEIMLDGTPEQVRNDPELERLYFGSIK